MQYSQVIENANFKLAKCGFKQFTEIAGGADNASIGAVIISSSLFHKTETFTLIVDFSDTREISELEIAGYVIDNESNINPTFIDHNHLSVYRLNKGDTDVTPTGLSAAFMTCDGLKTTKQIVNYVDAIATRFLEEIDKLTMPILRLILILPKQPVYVRRFGFLQSIENNDLGISARFMQEFMRLKNDNIVTQLAAEIIIGEVYEKST